MECCSVVYDFILNACVCIPCEKEVYVLYLYDYLDLFLS